MDTPHRNVNPDHLLPPIGFSHATVAAQGRTIYLGGQTGHYSDGGLDDGLVEQFAQALDNLTVVLEETEAHAHHLVSVAIYTTEIATYRASAKELGGVWKQRLGRHFPAMALFGVSELQDPAAQVEIVAIAVVPDASD